MVRPLDLTLYASTFPDLLEPRIQRDDLINLLRDRFGTERKVIVVQGPVGAGKTTLLAQFAKTFCAQSFSFFAGTTLPTSHPRSFLLDLSDQMAHYLEINVPDFEQLDTDRLTQLFIDFYRRVAREARRRKESVYFVVDGLEWIPTDSREPNILDFLPAEPPTSMFLLASSEPKRHFRFTLDAWDIPFFGLRNTEYYLDGLGLSKDELNHIFQLGGGMPGYLAGVRRLLTTGAKLRDIVADLPTELHGLFEIEWSRAKMYIEGLTSALAIMAYARERLSLADLATVSVSDEARLKEMIEKTSFVQLIGDKEGTLVDFISDAYRQFVRARLKGIRENAEVALVEHYSRNPYTKPSLALLPAYLASTGQHERLRDLITPDYLVRALESVRDVSLLRRGLRFAADSALQLGDLPRLESVALGSSMLREVSTRPIADKELEALCELGEFGRALEQAYQEVLPEDRLQLLGLVCSRMRKSGLSVPESIISDIEQIAASMDSKGLGERAVDIAGSLFDTVPQVAISLLERSVAGESGDQALDLARASLALRQGTTDPDSVRSSIRDQDLQDFVRALSPRVGKLTSAEVLAEVERIKGTAGKVHLLRTWCNENRMNPEAGRVVERALEVVTGDPGYGVSVLVLRQIAEPLRHCDQSILQRLLERIDLLKVTALRQPAEEGTRLELLLATLERKRFPDRGVERLLEHYLQLEQIGDLAIRCHSLARVVVDAVDIDPEDSLGILIEAKDRLTKSFHALLNESAMHYEVARGTLKTLAERDPRLALGLATLLNTAERRDDAVRDTIIAYLSSDTAPLDVSVVEDALRMISDRERMDRTAVRATRMLSRREAFSSVPEALRLIGVVERLEDARDQCFAYAFLLSDLVKKGPDSLVAHLRGELERSLGSIDSQWERVDVGMEVATILGRAMPDAARGLLERVARERAETPLAEGFFERIYQDCVELALLAFIGMVQAGRDDSATIERLIRQIEVIPSASMQCKLFADLAIVFHSTDQHDRFMSLMKEKVLPSMDACQEEGSKRRVLRYVAPALFEYHSDWAIEQLSGLPDSSRDRALWNVGKYLLSRRLAFEPVEFDSLRVRLDAKRARQVCQVMEAMKIDGSIYGLLDRLVETLVERNPRDARREVCVSLVERDALEIAARLEKIAEKKFPDPSNIPHEGYLIAARAAINRLRLAAARRANLASSWEDIISAARGIPNVADRALVLAWVGGQAYRSDPDLARRVIREAEGTVHSISNLLDRAERFYQVAKVWKVVDSDEAVKMLLRDAMGTLRSLQWNDTRDEVVGKILQLAHSVDPEFAAGLTPLLDNPMAEHMARLELKVRDLRRDPRRVTTIEAKKSVQDDYDSDYLLREASSRMLALLNAGSGQIRPSGEVGQWIREAVDRRFSTTYNVVSWGIRNTLAQTRDTGVLTGQFEAVVSILSLCTSFGRVLLGLRSESKPIISGALPESIKLFRAGERLQAMSSLLDWLKTATKEYLRIYDPYFGEEDLGILREVDPQVEVTIISSWKAQKGVAVGDRSVEIRFRDKWRESTDGPGPWIQVILVGVDSGDSPIHNRYIVTQGAGLVLGTSIGGLGLKDSDIHVLSAAEAARVESEFIDPLLTAQIRLYKGERVRKHVFVL